ncbi:MAG TPA: DUF1592 domain-containing protein [Planctomycetota bacterium]|nr:DUF1592 domain-containing protein [Planctomycetota bacterium]
MTAARPPRLLLSLLAGAGWLPAQVAPSPAQRSFLDANCVECHGGDSTKGKLDLTREPADPVLALWRWSHLRQRVHAGEMPPPDAEQPPDAEREAFLASVAATLQREVPKLPPDPGRVTVRRLSRTQWENAVRDLFGVRVSTAAFPADDLGYGFDSIGDALTFSTLHLEQYLAAAREVSLAVFDGEDPERPTVRRFEAEAMQLVDGPGAGLDGDIANLYTRATIEQRVRLPRDGTYRLRVLAGADQAGDEAARMALRFDDRDLETFVVENRQAKAFELTTTLPGGEHRFALAFLNDFYDPKNPDPARRDRNLHIDWLEVTGPLEPKLVPPAQQWLHDALPARGTDAARVRALVQQLLPAVWRRPATDAELGRVRRLASDALKRGEPLATALRLVLQAALASPNFLFRVESGGIEGRAGDVVPLSGSALATRLSFFLWSSTPDARLIDLARKGRLGDPTTLAEEAQRMLADARAESLATDFAAQWLELRLLQDRTPDPARFPGFDDGLRQSLRRETELLFLAVLREQRDVRDLLSCDFTYVDARLARFYGVELPAATDGVTAEGFHRIEWSGAQHDRGGVLGHASVLAVTSNPTRTSPVKRGRWILDNLLGQAPPPPPPGNDTLAREAAIDSSRTFREQLAQHRERKACAVCHVRMDVLGFALERFDAIGRYREADAGGPIDASGALPDGTQLDGLADLKRVLAADPAFVTALAHKLFVYAVGRDLRPVDRLRLDVRVEQLLARGRVTLPDLVLLVVQDDAFTTRVVVPGG